MMVTGIPFGMAIRSGWALWVGKTSSFKTH